MISRQQRPDPEHWADRLHGPAASSTRSRPTPARWQQELDSLNPDPPETDPPELARPELTTVDLLRKFAPFAAFTGRLLYATVRIALRVVFIVLAMLLRGIFRVRWTPTRLLYALVGLAVILGAGYFYVASG